MAIPGPGSATGRACRVRRAACWPVSVTPLEVYESGIHNRDERIHIDDIGRATEMHIDIVRRLLG